MSLRVLNISQELAATFVSDYHRHHEPPPGSKFNLGLMRGGGIGRGGARG